MKQIIMLAAIFLSVAGAKARTTNVFNHATAIEVNDSVSRVTAENDEVPPKFNGNLTKYLSKNLHYPSKAEKDRVQAKLTMSFVVERDGSLSNIKMKDIKVLQILNSKISGAPVIVQREFLKPSLRAMYKEAKRVIKAMPKWQPGIKNGKPGRARCYLTINFRP